MNKDIIIYCKNPKCKGAITIKAEYYNNLYEVRCPDCGAHNKIEHKSNGRIKK